MCGQVIPEGWQVCPSCRDRQGLVWNGYSGKWTPAPRFRVGDKVRFEDKEGIIYIVDIFGTFGQNDEPSYDIMNISEEGFQTLYKHIRQSIITKKDAL